MDDMVFGAVTCKSFGNYTVLDMAAAPVDGAALLQTAMDLSEACERIAWDDQVRAVVIVFDGDMGSLSLTDSAAGDALERPSLAAPVAGLKQPVIAAIRGNALGLGLELALACDLRIGTENARFGLPQVRQGSMPADGGTQRLPRLIGRGKATEMILTGEAIDAEEAQRLGLIHRIVPAESLMPAAAEIAREMAEKSPLSLNYCKEALHKGPDLTLDQGIQMELGLYLLLFSTTDRVEGITAFKEHRKPKFEGV